MIWLPAFIIALLGTAINVGFYVANPNPISLGGIVVCGGIALADLVLMTKERP